MAALPTNVGLTLWDALPVYLSVAIALALIARVWLPPAWFAGYWSLRRLLDPTGLVYLALFERQLVLIYVLTCAAAVGVLTVFRRNTATQYNGWTGRVPLLTSRHEGLLPPTPVAVLKQRAGEVFSGVLVAAIIAGIINLFSAYLPEPVTRLGIPLLANAFVGPAFGPSAIPAVAATSTSGSSAAGALWLVIAAALTTLQALARNAPTAPSPSSDTAPLCEQTLDN